MSVHLPKEERENPTDDYIARVVEVRPDNNSIADDRDNLNAQGIRKSRNSAETTSWRALLSEEKHTRDSKLSRGRI